MRIYLVDVRLYELMAASDRVCLRRAVVVAAEPRDAVACVQRAIQGGPMFSGYCDRGRFARPAERPHFDPSCCDVRKVGEARCGSPRILSWELLPPEGWGEQV